MGRARLTDPLMEIRASAATTAIAANRSVPVTDGGRTDELHLALWGVHVTNRYFDASCRGCRRSARWAAPAAAQHRHNRSLGRVGVVEAGVGQEQLGAATLRCQLPGHRRVKSGAASPADTQQLRWCQVRHLAVDDAVEALTGCRVGTESEVVPHHGLEIVGHQPRGEQVGVGERPPHFLLSMRQIRVSLNRGAHGLSSRTLRSVCKRPRQNRS